MYAQEWLETHLAKQTPVRACVQMTPPGFSARCIAWKNGCAPMPGESAWGIHTCTFRFSTCLTEHE